MPYRTSHVVLLKHPLLDRFLVPMQHDGHHRWTSDRHVLLTVRHFMFTLTRSTVSVGSRL